jgi:uncharacterized protein (TIGR02001 family)
MITPHRAYRRSSVVHTTSVFCSLALAIAGIATPAAAREAADPKFTFNVGANTEYVFRGISQSDEDPSIFGGVDATLGLAYAAVWASNVDFGNNTDAEYALFAGVRPAIGPVTLDFGGIYYGYIGQPAGSDQDYWEGKIAASVPAGPATVGAAVYYSPEFFGDTGDAWYYEANAVMQVPATKFVVSGVVGRQTRDVGPSYTTWNAAVGYSLNDQIAFELRYWDTAKDKYGDISSGRVVAGFKVAF